jgi:uncharacterized protein (TIGR01777 family)
MPHFFYESPIEASAAEVFAWHMRPGALTRLLPPWQGIEVVAQGGGVRAGGRVVLRLQSGPLRIRWVAEHRDVRDGEQFRDVQVKGPFARWEHTHTFRAVDERTTLLVDDVDYRLPLGALGALLADRRVRTDLTRTFRFRHARTARDVARHRNHAERGRLRIAITGASGLVGTQLQAFLTTGGHQVLRLVRRPGRAERGEVSWDPAAGRLDPTDLEGVDAVVHLAGESIGAGRWIPARKERIRASRVEGTRLLATALARMERPPRVLVSASGVDYYGDRGDAPLTEESPAGDGFLAEVCREWEAATEAAAEAGVRVVTLRTGMVISARGGALPRLLTPFRLGLGGPVGGGGQVMSWIALDDHIGVIHHLLFADDVSGPVNATSPRPVTNREFAATLGRVLRRPAVAPLPAAIVRGVFGEMGETLLLEGQRVLPARLEAAGFQFLYPDLESALRAELGR